MVMGKPAHFRVTARLLLSALPLAMVLQVDAAIAESGNGDGNSDQAKFEEQDLEEFKIELCRAHAGCNMTWGVGVVGRKAKKFLDSIGNAFSRKGSIDNYDVIDASEPDLVEMPETISWKSRIREAVMGRQSTKVEKSWAFGERVVEYREGKNSDSGKLTGAASILQTTGLKMRGNWENGDLNGTGQKIYSNGNMDIGQMKAGYLDGNGVRIGVREERIFAMEGKFIGGNPDGAMTVTYVDGSSERVLYAKGTELIRGERVAKGLVPVTPVYKTPEQLAAEAEANFQNLLKTGSALALYTAGERAFSRGDRRKARELFGAISSRFPADPIAATAIAQLARMDVADRDSAAAAAEARRVQLAQQQEAARQAQLAQAQREQREEARRQREAREEADRQRREAMAWGQLAGAIGQALGGGSGGARSGYSAPSRNYGGGSASSRSSGMSAPSRIKQSISSANGCISLVNQRQSVDSPDTIWYSFKNSCGYDVNVWYELRNGNGARDLGYMKTVNANSISGSNWRIGRDMRWFACPTSAEGRESVHREGDISGSSCFFWKDN